MPNPIVKSSRVLNPRSDYADQNFRMHRVKVQTLPDNAGYEASIETPQGTFKRVNARADLAAQFVSQDVRAAEEKGTVFPTK